MICPVCGENTKELYCSTCGKSLIDIYLKIVEDMQARREYDDALKIMKKLKEISNNEEISEELKEIEEGILFAKVQAESGSVYTQDDGEGKRKKVILVILIFIGVIVVNIGAWVILYKDTNKIDIVREEIIEDEQIDKSRFIKFVFEDISSQKLKYIEGVDYKDINGDNKKELIAVKEKNYFVFSPENGGALIYWYDLTKEKKVLGSDFELYNKRGSFKEKISGGDGFDVSSINMNYAVTSDGSIVFEGGGLRKIITVDGKGVEIEYSSTKTGGLEVALLLEPDLSEIYSFNNNVEVVEGEEQVTAKNLSSGYGIIINNSINGERILVNNEKEKILVIKFKNINSKIGIKKSE